MTPDLLEEGAKRAEVSQLAKDKNTQSGGREAGFSRIATAGEVDVTHGRILYLEDVNVSLAISHSYIRAIINSLTIRIK